MLGVLERLNARWEYLRSLRYELRLLPTADRVQVCSKDNAPVLITEKMFMDQMRSLLMCRAFSQFCRKIGSQIFGSMRINP